MGPVGVAMPTGPQEDCLSLLSPGAGSRDHPTRVSVSVEVYAPAGVFAGAWRARAVFTVVSPFVAFAPAETSVCDEDRPASAEVPGATAAPATAPAVLAPRLGVHPRCCAPKEFAPAANAEACPFTDQGATALRVSLTVTGRRLPEATKPASVD